MSAEITIPRLGWSMEEGVFVRWLKDNGQWVNAGDQLFLLESEKATQEIESLDAGHLSIPASGPQPGDTVKVGQVIAHLLAVGETAPGAAAAAPLTPATPTTATPTAAPPSPSPAAGPAARRLARKLNVPLDAVAGSGRSGQVTAGDVHAAAAQRLAGSVPAPSAAPVNGRNGSPSKTSPQPAVTTAAATNVAVTPRARRTARELGIDTAGLTGSGRGGRIRERDVQAAAATQSATPSVSPSAGATIKASTVRRTIARRMVASHQATAPVTLTTRVDATNLLNLRKQFQALAANADDIVPSITDLIVKLLAIAVAKHPRLNSQWHDEQIVEVAEVRVGVAVDVEAGLLVPVLPDARPLGVREIARHARDLVARARAGTLTASDLQGGTITVSNLGMFGIDAFTPIINPPEAAILGLGAIRREPVFEEGDRVVAREMMTLSLTFDHRLVDGAPAARFLATLRQGIENPAVWLAG